VEVLREPLGALPVVEVVDLGRKRFARTGFEADAQVDEVDLAPRY